MKKIIFISMFLLLSLVAGYSFYKTQQSTRTVANEILTESQQLKKDLIKDLKFSIADGIFKIESNYLQSICAEYTNIRLHYTAQNVAISGQSPEVTHSFSCEQIKQDSTQNTLTTDTNLFKNLENNTPIEQLTAHGLYADELFPESWKLSQIDFTGVSQFSILESELALFFEDQILTF